ncbi:hypothetical protein [Pelagicoccus sp. SDUM812003]|uniref:hypothetical protein n=1 Tax=Pelagicoccus sp. SDUM812003 TaxID=3041267 RepID=UPI00280E29DB|nr:hypothetical protein [Pelagicoccus sp. SDUM812003]MDQ8201618.1 hypothetical protein [Pelagicoccus sp. SDUM812003]
MMNSKLKKEPNFIEKKRQWKSSMEKPLGRRTLIMVLPALVLCVFVMMSAPYIKLIVEKVMEPGERLHLTAPLNLKDEPEAPVKEGPPPSPEEAMAKFYQDQYDQEGFDWRSKPQVDGPDLNYAKEKPVEVAPLNVDLPVTVSQLRNSSAQASREGEPEASTAPQVQE